MSRINTKKLALMGVLTALEVILSRFLSLNAWNMKIGFSFVPLVIAAVLLGPVYAAVLGALGDFIGATLFPIGAYFPGFTLTAALMGLVMGVFLYEKQSFPRIAAAVIINQFVLGLFLNTLWISVLYGSPYVPLLVTRVVQSALLTAVQLALIPVILRALSRFGGKEKL